MTDLSADDAARAAFESDPAGYLGERGYDLPDDLLGEAIGQVAAGLPATTAEHLSAFTTADSPIPTLDDAEVADVDPLDGLGLLASAPIVDDDTAPEAEGVDQPAPDPDLDADSGFGTGAGTDVKPGSDLSDPGFDDEASGVDDGGALEVGPEVDASSGLDGLDSSDLDGPTIEADADSDDLLTVDEPVTEADDPADLDGLD